MKSRVALPQWYTPPYVKSKWFIDKLLKLLIESSKLQQLQLYNDGKKQYENNQSRHTIHLNLT